MVYKYWNKIKEIALILHKTKGCLRIDEEDNRIILEQRKEQRD